MAWTYSGDPSSSSRDHVRFLVGDTDTTAQQLTDAEVTAQLTISGGALSAAAALSRALAAKYSRKIDKSIDGLSLQWSQLTKHYLDLAKQLESQGAYSALSSSGGVDGAVYAGGIYQADTAADEVDSSLKQPAFKRDQFPNLSNP